MNILFKFSILIHIVYLIITFADGNAELKEAFEVPDPRAAVNALKAILGETTKQTDIAHIL